jgi:hypothetical protein
MNAKYAREGQDYDFNGLHPVSDITDIHTFGFTISPY